MMVANICNYKQNCDIGGNVADCAIHLGGLYRDVLWTQIIIIAK
jgi:hypothetical protein